MHVFGLWAEAGAHVEIHTVPVPRIGPRIFLLWGDSAHHKVKDKIKIEWFRHLSLLLCADIISHIRLLGVIRTKDVLGMLGDIKNSLNEVHCPIMSFKDIFKHA